MAKNSAKKWRHDELQEDLAEHLRGRSDRMIWTDLQLGPMHSPRPDVFSMRKSYIKPNPLAYEIKVSVSDFRADVTSGKWKKYLDFAQGVIFAVPKGLITKADLPPTCGLIVRSENVWREQKAPTLDTTLPDFYAMQKLLIESHTEHLGRMRKHRGEWFIESEAANKALGKEVAAAVRNLRMVESRAKYLEESAVQRDQRATEQERRILQSAREKAATIVDDAAKPLAELYEFLEVEPGASMWQLRNAMDRLKERLNRDSVIESMRNSIKSAYSAIERLEEKLPPA